MRPCSAFAEGIDPDDTIDDTLVFNNAIGLLADASKGLEELVWQEAAAGEGVSMGMTSANDQSGESTVLAWQTAPGNCCKDSMASRMACRAAHAVSVFESRSAIFTCTPRIIQDQLRSVVNSVGQQT